MAPQRFYFYIRSGLIVSTDSIIAQIEIYYAEVRLVKPEQHALPHLFSSFTKH
jgi:hypothetical protein